MLHTATVTVERAQIQGTKTLQGTIAGKAVHPSFWPAKIQEPCIIGLNVFQKAPGQPKQTTFFFEEPSSDATIC